MKGIVILGFDEKFKVNIDTQVPSNLSEFLGLNSKLLSILADLHKQNKMEPHLIETKLNDELEVISFYSGFSFRHYVGKPHFAISIFLSEGDEVFTEVEGMLRRLAHELLPKREALNFDDILGQYYEMLKKEELTPFWEEIVEGESSEIPKKELTKMESKVTDSNKNQEGLNQEEELKDMPEEIGGNGEKTQELQELLEEKMGKIRELSKKFTDLTTEKNSLLEQIESLKKELSEQYIKLERWSKQMADLSENNAKLMDEIKSLNKNLRSKEDTLLKRERENKELQNKLKKAEEIEKEAEKTLQEKDELLQVEEDLNSQIEQLNEELEKIRNQNSIHLDSITNLKLEIKKHKDLGSDNLKETKQLQEEIFDLKKEIKVLRRERDHYQKIVKDKKLL